MRPHQKNRLAAMDGGQILVRHFDVWAGYWWRMEPSGARVSANTVGILLSAKAIVEGENRRVGSGSQRMEYSLPADASQAQGERDG